MSDPAKADPNNNTLGSFLTSLALNGGLLVLQVGFFILLKNKLERIYSPRTYLPPPNLRADELAPGAWKWLPQIFVTSSQSIIRKNGLDAYMSIRFFEMMMKIFGVFTVATWIVLLPINAAGMPATLSDGLGRLGFGNINPTNQSRYWAHLLMSYCLTIFVLWMMRRELMLFVHLRQRFLLSPYHSRLAQAKTVLITSLPTELANEADLRQLFSFVPGGIKQIWIYRNVSELPELFEERDKLCLQLEGAVTGLLQTAIKARSQQEEKMEKQKKAEGKGKGSHKHTAFPLRVHANLDDEAFAGDLEKIGAEKLLDSLHRPKHRLGWIPFHGKQVDTIDYCVEHIRDLNERIKELRKKLPDEKPFGSCFIQCNLQIGAHVLAQCVSYHEPLFMSQRWVEMAPEDVVWANIDDGAYEVRTRYVLSWAATLGLIILWGFPVALAGFTSNVSAACATHSWLAWICRTPRIVQSIIQGVFPPVLLAILFLILPYLLRGLAWFENIPRYSLISLSVYKRYFMFLVVHGFLIITFFSALSEVLRDIQDPTKLVQNFSVYLPNASTFFLTYMLQQGLMGAAGALLQVGPLILYFVKKIFLGNTPREAFEAKFMMPSFDFGIMLPRMSLLATIGFAYAIISPIINGLALVTFALFWCSWKFLLIWVLDQPDAQETSGLYFPLLMSNLFTGLYIQHICLMGLFFFAHNASNQHVTIAQGVLMALLIVITASVQIFFKYAFDPVIKFLPMSLSTRKLAERFDKEKRDGDPVEIAGVDLFSRERVRSVVRHKLRLRRGTSQRVSTTLATEANKARAEDKDKEADRLEDEASKRKASEKAMNKADDILATADDSAPVPIQDTSIKLQEPETSNQLNSHDANHAQEATLVQDPNYIQDPSKSHVSLTGSHKTGRSKDTEKSKKKEGKVLGAWTAAQPDALKVDAPAKALRDEDGSDDDDDLEEHAFDHPSTYMEQKWIWIPKWETFPSLSEELVKELKDGKVDASDIGALIDEGGNVEVSRGPPDEDWSGGHDN